MAEERRGRWWGAARVPVKAEVSAGSCSQTQVSEVGCLRHPTPHPHPHPLLPSIPPFQLHCQLHLSISTPTLPQHQYHHQNYSFSSYLLMTMGHQPCRDTVIYTLYFYFSSLSSLSYPSQVRRDTLPLPNKQRDIKKLKREAPKYLLPLAAAAAGTRYFAFTHPPPPSDPCTPSPTFYYYLHPTPSHHPSPPITPGLYLSACLFLPVCSCLPKVRYCSRSLQRQPSLFLSPLSLSLSHTPSIQPLLVNTFLPVLINFFSFSAAHTHTHACTHTAVDWLAVVEDAL